MINYMFKEVKMLKISSSTVKDNIASCRIFEKLGFNKIGEIIEESPYTFYDELLFFSKYELTKESYFNNENAVRFYDSHGYHSRMYTNIKKIK